MRGKHANAAKNRRDRVELEERAHDAERRAEQLEKQLVELRETSERRIASLRGELREALKERDAAVSPVLTQAAERIRGLTVERDRAIEESRLREKRWHSMDANLRAVLRGMGLTDTEAIESIIASYEPDGKARTLVHSVQHANSTSQILAVERARGQRSGVDPLAQRRLQDRSPEERGFQNGVSEPSS